MPAFLAATADKHVHHEAVVEHAGAMKLVTQIEAKKSNMDLQALGDRLRARKDVVQAHERAA